MMKVLVSQKSYGGSEVLEIETRIRLIHDNSTSFIFEGHNFIQKFTFLAVV